MKNTIPLIMAVILGLAAVFAVSRTIARSSTTGERTIDVVVANMDLRAGDELSDGKLSYKTIPYSGFISQQQVPWQDRALLEGRKLKRAVANKGFIFYDHVEGSDAGFSREVGVGEWVVPVHFADASLSGLLEVGDEVAIVTIREESKAIEVTGGQEQTQYMKQEQTRVLFPAIRILRKEEDGIFVSLPPKTAMKLLMANKNMPLFPLLRRRGDTENTSVRDMVVTMDDLKQAALEKSEEVELRRKQ